jgi:multifunctional 2-oxoglutarate metabolism enzyme
VEEANVTVTAPAVAGSGPDFGPNEWLVFEIYQQYLAEPESVSPEWREFLSDYRPNSMPGGPGAALVDGNGVVPAAGAPVAHPNGTAAKVAPAPPGPAPAPAHNAPKPADGAHTSPLRGAAARVVTNMETSLYVPTATSVRAVPAKLLQDNRVVINRHLARSRGGKVSFTHLIGYAMVKALAAYPQMNHSYGEVAGKPVIVEPEHVNLGLAIDLVKGSSRQLVVAAVKQADTLDFSRFWMAYEDIVRRARTGKLTADDFTGVTVSLTNPGGIGTVHSVPRLMEGQGTIIGVGAMEYPAEFQGAAAETLARLGISKIITLTSTYDHRIIQGAQSGEYLRRMHALLLGEDDFYEEVFRSLRIPYEPIRWVPDIAHSHEGELDKNARVLELIHAYRVRGHLMADTDPLEFAIRSHPDLDIIGHGLTLWDLDREFPVGSFGAADDRRVGTSGRTMTLRDILGVLRDSYCRRVGIEYMHIQEPAERAWIQERVERSAERPDPAFQLHVLERLNAAEAFESFLQTKYVGQKRFSLEGAESVIPLLDEVLSGAAEAGLDEVVIGMPHRGRLNVLANIVGKPYRQIFQEFQGYVDPGTAHGSGDVKYHLGADGTFTSRTGDAVAVTLTSNPSHLEAVDPVLEGVVRAKQDLLDKGPEGYTVLPLLMHGDAAFAGQGVVAETLNLSQLRGYRTGGTVHVVVNNQVGFTTSPKFGRSSVYATDVARMVQAPIFHVNGDDPEACVRVARLAFEFRQAFHKDVVVDMVCYRRRGHSEVDEPSFTQPLMYDTIDAKRSVRKLYTEALIGRGDITLEEAEQALKNYSARLETVFAETRGAIGVPAPSTANVAHGELTALPVATAVPLEMIKKVVDTQVSWPAGFTVHPRLRPQLERRPTMVADGTIDWACAETLAFGTLLLDGRSVRLTGQDSRRGTFGQRHAVVVDRKTGDEFTPLKTLRADDGPTGSFYVHDSLLSEFAAMGFEYGYSVARPDALVLWEAQFGDFANGAQSIIDEFIAAGEAKWGQQASLALLLPHGYEGQGPDHSSARIERYLSLCADGNMSVAMPSEPANYFHLLRRQAAAPVRRPLIVFTPKSMLRLKAATSRTADLTNGAWRPVLDDAAVADRAGVHKVLLCSGKVYYDLAAGRAKRTDTAGVAVVRVEQLYPTPTAEVAATLRGYPNVSDVVWVQEEPANQGPYPHMALALSEVMPAGIRLRRVSRRASASPASGSSVTHQKEQEALVEAAFTA